MERAQIPFIDALERRGHRLTAPRRRVARLIARRDGHFTAADLLEDARRDSVPVGRATIFRSLELFAGLGALERLDLPSGEHAYVACEPLHHHHVVCSRCGRTAEVADLGLPAVVDEVRARTGFRIDEHRLELYGLCPDCQARGAMATNGNGG
ncbi:MAG: transcriptional repressor [Chloroflexota bacterium]|nr:transcriptional repressor [Chloroflexota bacterium]